MSEEELAQGTKDLMVYTGNKALRKAWSERMGTAHVFERRGHWVMKLPRKACTFDDGVQHWHTREFIMDTLCSAYSLYNELRYYLSHNKQPPSSRMDIPPLLHSEQRLLDEMVANRPGNIALMKLYLPLVADLLWPVIPKWDNWSMAETKGDYLKCLAHFRGPWPDNYVYQERPLPVKKRKR